MDEVFGRNLRIRMWWIFAVANTSERRGRFLLRLALLIRYLWSSVACQNRGDGGGFRWRQMTSFDNFYQQRFLVIVVNERKMDLS